jgi:hypothetical protein
MSMTMTGEITIAREAWLVRAAIALTRWGRRRRVRADLSDLYFGEADERRASLEEQLLLDRERRAARIELDRTKAMSSLYRGF